jgi:broad specificity polyphosphatase/5'/3'-nucleotidase SurE
VGYVLVTNDDGVDSPALVPRPGIEIYSIDGFPADCTNLGVLREGWVSITPICLARAADLGDSARRRLEREGL